MELIAKVKAVIKIQRVFREYYKEKMARERR